MLNTLRKFSLTASCSTLVLALASQPVASADSLFSSVRIGDAQMSAKQARLAGDVNDSQGVGKAANSPDAVFNISISVHGKPAGDNDAKTDAGASDDAQNAYEKTIKFFADGVCEQTNGAHKIGVVRILKDGAQGASVDVKWQESGGPAAHTTGFGKDGWQIFFYDKFPGGDIDANGNFNGGTLDINNGARDQEMMGYILAHEWGHYTLGLYDEYQGNAATGTQPSQPVSSDTATSLAIMSRERVAQTGEFKWLNHSTSNNIGDVTKTAQGRVYGKSGWDTLIQTTNNDPTSINNWNKPKRTHYTNLVGKQPTATDKWYKIQLPGDRATCRDKLDIRWIEDIEIDVVLDRSGSMGGSPIVNARSAAQSLVDIVPGGSTALGVSSFSSSVRSDAAVTPIPDPGTAERTTLKNAIGSIGAGGSTAMFDGAVFGLNKLTSFATTNNTNATQLVFLLSDGGDNSSSETASSTISKFNAAGASIIAFGYGSSFDQRLVNLANATGGRFFQSPTTAAQIQAAFSQAFADVSGSNQVASSVSNAAGGDTQTTDFVIDDTMEALTITFAYSGAVSDFTLSLLDANGADTGQTFTCTGAANCLLALDQAALTALGNGTFTVSAVNNTGSATTTSVNIVSTPKPGGSYSLRLDSQGGDSVTYPEPIVLSAVISKDLPIVGAQVQASITDPSNAVTVIDLNDDGVGADQFANDGIYSAWAPYTVNGNYTIDVTVTNPTGAAAYSVAALSPTHYAQGQSPAPVPKLSPANFQRNSQLQLSVSGVVGDDHNDDPTGACTAILADNSGVSGKIDSAGDADCFFINPASFPAGDLVARVFNLALGADPKFKVFDSTGTTEIADVDPANKKPSNGALFEKIAAANVDPAGMVILVSDTDATHAGGTYSVSTGTELASDKAVSAPAPIGGGGGGGAVGPWGLLGMAFLAMLGLVRRRRGRAL